MTHDDLLTRLPDAGYPVTPRPLPSIVERAHQIRRGKRLYALGGLSSVAAGLAVLSVWTGIQLPGTGSGSVTPASSGQASSQDAGQDCSSGYAYTARRQSLADLLYLPSARSAGPITGEVVGRRETSNCAYTKPEGIAYAMKDGVVSTRLEISGPDARNQYDSSEAGPGTGSSSGTASFLGATTTAEVGGGTARLYSMAGADWIYMFWTAPDESTWSIQSDGLTRDELLAAVDALEFSDGQLGTSDVPAGFDAWASLPKVAYTAKDRHEYRYVLVPLHGGESSPGWEFEIADRPAFGDAPIGGREVKVGSVTGWWKGDGAGGGNKGQGQLVWRIGDTELRVSGNSAQLSESQALEIARSVTKVGVGDSRLVAAWE